MTGLKRPLAVLCAAAGLALLPAPAIADHLPQVELLASGEIGPPQDHPIEAAATWAGLPLVVRSEKQGLALYGLFFAKAQAPKERTASLASPAPASPAPMSLLPTPTIGSPTPGSPAAVPTPPPAPAFDARQLLQDDLSAQAVAMASNGSKVVLGVLGTNPDGYSVKAQVWLPGPQGHASPGRPLTLERGPTKPSHLVVAVSKNGHAVLAWSAKLPGRRRSLRVRAIRPDRTLSPLRLVSEPGFALQSPSIAPAPFGFVLAYAKRAATSRVDRPARSRPTDAGSTGSVWAALKHTLDIPPSGPMTQIIWQPVTPRGARLGPARSTRSRGLDHPDVITRADGFRVFWTDPRGGGRELRFRAATSTGWRGKNLFLRTDLRPELRTPYCLAPVGREMWLAIWPQFVDAVGGPMVLEGRLYYPHDYAISPPLLLARSSGTISPRGLIFAGKDTWVALWDDGSGGQHHLDDRPLHITF